ncbi:GlcNac transferase [Phytophthora palmivora]|uniref:GlcNac transferase n=1 Tax=Phytophthora palmivora TaxID=4796 RepID=A0A2P4X9C9_9STRA|nr:GlcNac transferase [Phytophthora palmivora]
MAPPKMLLLLLAAALVLTSTAAEGMQSVMGIVNTKRSVKLDPSVQHIPLDPSKANLRPPPAQIPASFDIFVGLSVFRDGFRCGKTIFTGLKRAKYPERLFFGVVDQVNDGDERCLDEYCKMAEVEWPDKGPCPYKDHIRVDIHSASESRGPTLARHQQQKLIQQEEFCLQLDGHSIFTNLWDENLLAEWKRVDNEMAVLSTYLHHIHDFVKENGDNALSASLPHLCTTTRGSNGLVRTVGASMISGSKFPQLEALWGAGLSFNKCHAERRVPVDSHTLWMFDGEEFLRASRLWTNGYDMYSPSVLGSVIYHNYSKVPARFEHITVDPQVKKRESEMGVNRFNHLVGKPVKGMVDTYELDKYGFGTVRSFKSYQKFSGVTFQEGVNDTESCEQLHWVPYENATEVEALMGNGWKLQTTLAAAEPTPQVQVAQEIEQEGKGQTVKETTETSQPTKQHVVVDDDPNAEVARHAADAHAENGADIGENEQLEEAKVRLRQDVVNNRSAKGPSSAPVWFFLFVVVAALFVTLSNDSVSRSIRLTFCTSSPHTQSSKE